MRCFFSLSLSPFLPFSLSRSLSLSLSFKLLSCSVMQGSWPADRGWRFRQELIFGRCGAIKDECTSGPSLPCILRMEQTWSSHFDLGSDHWHFAKKLQESNKGKQKTSIKYPQRKKRGNTKCQYHEFLTKGMRNHVPLDTRKLDDR